MLKKIKLKYLMLIYILFMINKSIYIFADTKTNINGNPPQNSTTTLDGEIGEWDPTISDKPDFDNGLEIEGNKPGNNDYVTISATVPISMEFMVLPSSYSEFGNFFSPNYTIENNGGKDIVVKLKTFTNDNSISNPDIAPLYVERLSGGDNKTQMELKLCSVSSTDWTKFDKVIDLVEFGNLTDDDKVICELNSGETKVIKFDADRWEIPKYESKKENASSKFVLGLEISIK